MDGPPPTTATPQRCSGAELLHWRRKLLQISGTASELDWLLEMEGGLAWQHLQQLQLKPDQTVLLRTPLDTLANLWRRYQEGHEPLQYLVGRCPWRDLELTVAPGVLIPRQETELLVELACAVQQPSPASSLAATPNLWADLGTGSGCLAAALARAWPASQGVAVDLSRAALEQAASNLQRFGLGDRVQLRHGSWWDPLDDLWGRLELVVSNPPYIPTTVWENLDPVVKEHEPELALHGGGDGLEAIRAIAAGAAKALAPGGWLLLEHHHDQSPAVLSLLASAGLEAIEARTDLEGRCRFAIAQRRPDGGSKP